MRDLYEPVQINVETVDDVNCVKAGAINGPKQQESLQRADLNVDSIDIWASVVCAAV